MIKHNKVLEAGGEGGGIYCTADAKINDNIISANLAPLGAGIHCKRPCTISNNEIIDNNGVGIFCSVRTMDANLEGTILISTNSIASNAGAGVLCSDHVPDSPFIPEINQPPEYRSLAVTIVNNKIVANNGIGIACASGSNSVIGNTITANKDVGILARGIKWCVHNPPGLQMQCTIELSSVIVANTIIWGNHRAALHLNNYSTVSVSHSDIEEGPEDVNMYAGPDPNCTLNWGPGNIDTDPRFADAGYWDPNGTPEDANDDFWVDGDYHLKSQAGRWDPNSQTWVQDDVTSPCIDAGNPMSPIGLEPFPNGGLINMGAYGGTAEASKSYFGKPPCEIIVAGDINGDCEVNFLDFRLMALHWLQNNSP